MPFDVIEAHRLLALEIKTAAERAGLLQEGANTQDVGDARESILKSAIRSWFPSTHTLFRGQLVSPVDLAVTRPIDVVVANTAEWCPLVEVNHATQILAEAARAVVEVKSTLSKDEFVNALEKLSQAAHQKRHCRLEPQRFASCLFAYSGPAQAGTVLGWLPDVLKSWSNAVAPRPYLPNCIVVLQKYALVIHGQVNASPSPVTLWEFPQESTEYSMLVMHQVLEQRLDLQVGYPLFGLVPDGHAAVKIAKRSSQKLPDGFDAAGW